MQIKELIAAAYTNALQKGFWEDLDCPFTDISTQEHYNAIGNRLMMIVGEVAEAHESLRKLETTNFVEELADVMIRLADLCGGLDLDLEDAIIKKMAKNKLRPYKHGKLF